MKNSYIFKLEGMPEEVNQSVRNLNRVFREYYNVFGVRQLASWLDRKTGHYTIKVELTADWWSSEWIWFPDALDIIHAWHRKDARQRLEDVIINRVEG